MRLLLVPMWLMLAIGCARTTEPAPSAPDAAGAVDAGADASGASTADRADVPICVPACSGDLPADEDVSAACTAIGDGHACWAHTTGGFPSRCRWVTERNLNCARNCSELDAASCAREAACLEQLAHRVQADRSDGQVFAACVTPAHACLGDEEETLTCAASRDGELFVFPSTCIPPDWTPRPPTDCDAQGLPDCAALDIEACAAASDWCVVLEGHPYDSDGGGVDEPLGCRARDRTCGDAQTCAEPSFGGERYVFPTRCIPTGWSTCGPPSP